MITVTLTLKLILISNATVPLCLVMVVLKSNDLCCNYVFEEVLEPKLTIDLYNQSLSNTTGVPVDFVDPSPPSNGYDRGRINNRYVYDRRGDE